MKIQREKINDNFKELYEKKGEASTNANLLQNWDWRNPINQRGNANYAGVGYTIDRLISVSAGARVEVFSNYVRLSSPNDISYIMQRIEPKMMEALDGKTLTLSVMTAANNILSRTFNYTYGVSPGGAVSGINIPDSTGEPGITMALTGTGPEGHGIRIEFTLVAGRHAHIKAIKLEVGAVSTLANDAPMDYGVELAKCTRYQRVYSTNSVNTQGQTSPPMRINPAVVQLTAGANSGMFLYDANL